MSPQKSTVVEEEVARFAALADTWWDPNGPFRPIHKFNPVRLRYIRDRLIEHFNLDKTSATPLKGISILDVGCGGGVLSEPLARLGAEVIGIDPAEKNVRAAEIHAAKEGVSVSYRAITAEELEASGARFDVVLAMEVVEHVSDVNAFVATTANMVKPGGLFFSATINRTLKAYALAIVGAEYILRWLPKGTHSYDMLVKPEELRHAMEDGGLKQLSIEGVFFNPIKDEWRLSSDTDVNYMVMAMKPKG